MTSQNSYFNKCNSNLTQKCYIRLHSREVQFGESYCAVTLSLVNPGFPLYLGISILCPRLQKYQTNSRYCLSSLTEFNSIYLANFEMSGPISLFRLSQYSFISSQLSKTVGMHCLSESHPSPASKRQNNQLRL